MGIFTRMFHAWALKTQRKEMSAFVDQLAGMDGKEIGFLVAVATHQRNVLEEDGFRLMDPLVDYPMNPTVALRLGGIIREYQKAKQPSDAAGTMIWLHTMRVGGRHELRPLAREMWRQLSRGFPYVEESAFEIMRLTLKLPKTSGYDRFPAGLTPDPL
ncbi:hypothetical protein AB688_18470 [Pseudomonas putida]|uniref:hypothetical protein n=1 Tax=Pseudomonas putida TaxID=303 RepID=UPI0007B6B516|nr:hypothetical protein [Pseudomonas putida]ANC03987.1 hypothetical protein AB688_18470 [Pseudomonas putida]